MPDFAMCRGAGCDRRSRCYRYLAVPSGSFQDWMVAPADVDGCRFFKPVPRGVWTRRRL